MRHHPDLSLRVRLTLRVRRTLRQGHRLHHGLCHHGLCASAGTLNQSGHHGLCHPPTHSKDGGRFLRQAFQACVKEQCASRYSCAPLGAPPDYGNPNGDGVGDDNMPDYDNGVADGDGVG